jgi:hypothetical protein
MHQRANARAAALWRWRADVLRQLAMQEQPPSPSTLNSQPSTKA